MENASTRGRGSISVRLESWTVHSIELKSLNVKNLYVLDLRMLKHPQLLDA